MLAMEALYPWLKTLHVLLAIAALGTNLTYAAWQIRAAREPEHMGWALRGIKLLDDRIANPSYAGLLIVGILLVLTGGWEFTDTWIAASLVLYFVMLGIAIALYAPAQRRQIAAYEADGTSSAEFVALNGRVRTLGIVMTLIVVVIVVLMVVKPGA